MAVLQVSRVHVTGEKRVSFLKVWPREALRDDQVSRPRSAIETIMAACGNFENSDYHDGWTPVRARHDGE